MDFSNRNKFLFVERKMIEQNIDFNILIMHLTTIYTYYFCIDTKSI